MTFPGMDKLGRRLDPDHPWGARGRIVEPARPGVRIDMETFAEPRDFAEHGSYRQDREDVMSGLDPGSIDVPILDLVQGFARLGHCFTLQSCYGHFMWDGQSDPHSLEVLPERDVGSITYCIAYVALCLEQSAEGARLRESLARICALDPEYIQFGSPGWFWEQYPNSYALQVEPDRFRMQDTAVMAHHEAFHVQTVRDKFFARLREVVTFR